MSRIDELIAEHCPDGVSFARIGEIAEVGTGSSDRKDATSEGLYPFYVRSKEVLRINQFEFDEEAIIIPGEGGVGEIFHFVQGKYALHQRAYRISFRSELINPRFGYFYFSTHFKEFILKKAVSATVTSIRKPMISDFTIPIIPLEVQLEIVSILDAMTSLQAELQAELAARRSQYEFYRDSLLNFNDAGTPPWKWAKLGEVGLFVRGNGIQKSDFVESGVGCIHYGQIFTHFGTTARETKSFVTPEKASKSRSASTGDLVIATTSENISDVCKAVAWIGEETVAISGDSFVYKHSLDPLYVAFFFQSTAFQLQKERIVYGTKVMRVSRENLEKIDIPVPPISVQKEIAEVLMKFDVLLHDISIGLPAEIKARRQQYEYYRDQLLSFKELAA